MNRINLIIGLIASTIAILGFFNIYSIGEITDFANNRNSLITDATQVTKQRNVMLSIDSLNIELEQRVKRTLHCSSFYDCYSYNGLYMQYKGDSILNRVTPFRGKYTLKLKN